MFMRNRLARKMAAEMREATCAGTQTSKAPTLSGPSVTNHYSVAQRRKRLAENADFCRHLSYFLFLMFFGKLFASDCLSWW